MYVSVPRPVDLLRICLCDQVGSIASELAERGPHTCSLPKQTRRPSAEVALTSSDLSDTNLNLNPSETVSQGWRSARRTGWSAS